MSLKLKTLILIIMSVCFTSAISFVSEAYTITYRKDQVSKEVFTTRQSTIDPETGKEVFVLIDDKPTLQNFSFIGWRIEDSNEVYSAGRKIKAEKNLTVTGQFAIGTCTVRYSDESESKTVLYGTNIQIKTFGQWYGREFDKCVIKKLNDGDVISYANQREYVEVTSDILIEPIYKDYDKSIFAKDIYFGKKETLAANKIDYDEAQSPVGYSYENTADQQPLIGYTLLSSADSIDNAIVSLMFFEYEAADYHDEEGKSSGGYYYTFAKNLDTNKPHNLRCNYLSEKLLFLGYAKKNSDDNKVMAHSITSRFYNISYFNSKYTLDSIREEAINNNCYVVDVNAPNHTDIFRNRTDIYNDITYDLRNIQDFIPYYSVYDSGKRKYDNLSGSDWMASIPDNYYVTELNLPGTHDSGAAQGISFNSYTKTQHHPIYTQLEMGCRYLDIRTYYENGFLKLIHGEKDLEYTEWYEKIDKEKLGRKGRTSTKFLLFEDAVFEAVKFVTMHPTETVLFSIQADREFVKTISENVNEVRNVLEAYRYGNFGAVEANRIYTENRVPTLGEARGKVIILNVWWHDWRSDGKSKSIQYGLDVSAWGNNTPRSSEFVDVIQLGGHNKQADVINKQIIPFLSACETSGEVPLSTNIGKNATKHLELKYIHELVKNTTTSKRLFYFMNTQCRHMNIGKPINNYEKIHKEIKDHDFKQGVYYGAILFDFGDDKIFQKIYLSNFPSWRTIYR